MVIDLASVQLRSLEQGLLEERITNVEFELGLFASPKLGAPESEPIKPCDDKH